MARLFGVPIAAAWLNLITILGSAAVTLPTAHVMISTMKK
jgi:hypothetical protein